MLCDKDKKESCLVLQFPAWHPKLSAFYLVLLLYCILTDLHGFLSMTPNLTENRFDEKTAAHEYWQEMFRKREKGFEISRILTWKKHLHLETPYM